MKKKLSLDNKCPKGENCLPCHRVEFKSDNYICSGVSKDCTYKCDNIVVCINTNDHNSRYEMTEKEGLIIIQGILASIYQSSFHNK